MSRRQKKVVLATPGRFDIIRPSQFCREACARPFAPAPVGLDKIGAREGTPRVLIQVLRRPKDVILGRVRITRRGRCDPGAPGKIFQAPQRRRLLYSAYHAASGAIPEHGKNVPAATAVAAPVCGRQTLRILASPRRPGRPYARSRCHPGALRSQNACKSLGRQPGSGRDDLRVSLGHGDGLSELLEAESEKGEADRSDRQELGPDGLESGAAEDDGLRKGDKVT
jgi:hypothetical protein